MDTPKKEPQLLEDLESIRQLLDEDELQLPLLTDVLEPDEIPLLSEIVAPLHDKIAADTALAGPRAELREVTYQILQEVIDDFLPQIEMELRRRLNARLPYLVPSRKDD